MGGVSASDENKTLVIHWKAEQLPTSFQWSRKPTSPLPLMPMEMNWS